MLAGETGSAVDAMPFSVDAAMAKPLTHRRKHVAVCRPSVPIPETRDSAHLRNVTLYCPQFMLALSRFPAFAAFLAGARVSWRDLHISTDEVMALCNAEDLSALVHHRLVQSTSLDRWPAPLPEFVSARARACAGEEMLRGAETRAVVAALASAGVRSLIIKGTHLAYSLYPMPAVRARDDTDLLIAAGDVEPARAVMRALGYTVTVHCSELFSQFEVQKRDRLGVLHAYDVHWKISTQPVFADVLTYEEMIPRAHAVPSLGPAAIAPAPADALLLACIHPVMHHQNTERILWVYDIHLIASSLSTPAFAEFTERAVDKKVAAVCAHQLRRVENALGTMVPPGIIDELSHAGRGEPSARYLASHRRWHHELASSVRGLPTFGARMKLLRDVLVPAPSYMLGAYRLRGKPLAPLLLPALYVHRNARGAWKILTGKK
jgi:hypothetical protein